MKACDIIKVPKAESYEILFSPEAPSDLNMITCKCTREKQRTANEDNISVMTMFCQVSWCMQRNERMGGATFTLAMKSDAVI